MIRRLVGRSCCAILYVTYVRTKLNLPTQEQQIREQILRDEQHVARYAHDLHIRQHTRSPKTDICSLLWPITITLRSKRWVIYDGKNTTLSDQPAQRLQAGKFLG